MDDLQSWFYRGLVEAGDDPFAAADRLVAETPLASARACASGCAACCEFPVGVTDVETRRIAAWLRSELAVDELAVLRARLANGPARTDARQPCVLLDDDRRCRVYPVRPVACRGWTSTSRAACDAGEPAADPAAFAACAGVHEALRRAGDGETRELGTALRSALDSPDA